MQCFWIFKKPLFWRKYLTGVAQGHFRNSSANEQSWRPFCGAQCVPAVPPSILVACPRQSGTLRLYLSSQGSVRYPCFLFKNGLFSIVVFFLQNLLAAESMEKSWHWLQTRLVSSRNPALTNKASLSNRSLESRHENPIWPMKRRVQF